MTIIVFLGVGINVLVSINSIVQIGIFAITLTLIYGVIIYKFFINDYEKKVIIKYRSKLIKY